MTQIERRQARIRRIRKRLEKKGEKPAAQADIVASSDARYHLGMTQNQPVHIMSFVHKYSGDPAIKVDPHFTSSCPKSMLTYSFTGLYFTSERSYIVTCPTYAAA